MQLNARGLDDMVIICTGLNEFEVPHVGTSSRRLVPPSADVNPPGPANCLCQHVSETFVDDGVNDDIYGRV